MARSVRAASLETRATRLRLPAAKKPAFVKIGPRLGSRLPAQPNGRYLGRARRGWTRRQLDQGDRRRR
jgi:hypothetical protein